jgi:hypothetical protein
VLLFAGISAKSGRRWLKAIFDANHLQQQLDADAQIDMKKNMNN